MYTYIVIKVNVFRIFFTFFLYSEESYKNTHGSSYKKLLQKLEFSILEKCVFDQKSRRYDARQELIEIRFFFIFPSFCFILPLKSKVNRNWKKAKCLQTKSVCINCFCLEFPSILDSWAYLSIFDNRMVLFVV